MTLLMQIFFDLFLNAGISQTGTYPKMVSVICS
jgi:hypothetical protein